MAEDMPVMVIHSFAQAKAGLLFVPNKLQLTDDAA